MYVCMYIYVYIQRERERERERIYIYIEREKERVCVHMFCVGVYRTKRLLTDAERSALSAAFSAYAVGESMDLP
jgi:hypothetical protein